MNKTTGSKVGGDKDCTCETAETPLEQITKQVTMSVVTMVFRKTKIMAAAASGNYDGNLLQKVNESLNCQQKHSSKKLTDTHIDQNW